MKNNQSTGKFNQQQPAGKQNLNEDTQRQYGNREPTSSEADSTQRERQPA